MEIMFNELIKDQSISLSNVAGECSLQYGQIKGSLKELNEYSIETNKLTNNLSLEMGGKIKDLFHSLENFKKEFENKSNSLQERQGSIEMEKNSLIDLIKRERTERIESERKHTNSIVQSIENANIYLLDRIGHMLVRLDKLEKGASSSASSSSAIREEKPFMEKNIMKIKSNENEMNENDNNSLKEGKDEVNQLKMEMQILNKKCENFQDLYDSLGEQLKKEREEKEELKKRMLNLEDKYRREMKEIAVCIEKNRRKVDLIEEETRNVKGQVIKVCSQFNNHQHLSNK